MSLFLKDGDYVPDGKGGFCGLSETEELLQRVLFRLMARRGGFPLLPKLGSRLYCLPREKSAKRAAQAKQYVEEALEEERNLNVLAVDFATETGVLVAHLSFREERFSITVPMDLEGEVGR